MHPVICYTQPLGKKNKKKRHTLLNILNGFSIHSKVATPIKQTLKLSLYNTCKRTLNSPSHYLVILDHCACARFKYDFLCLPRTTLLKGMNVCSAYMYTYYITEGKKNIVMAGKSIVVQNNCKNITAEIHMRFPNYTRCVRNMRSE